MMRGRTVGSGYASQWARRAGGTTPGGAGAVSRGSAHQESVAVPRTLGAVAVGGRDGAPSFGGGAQRSAVGLFGTGIGVASRALASMDLPVPRAVEPEPVAIPRPVPVRVTLPDGLAADSLLGMSWTLFQYCQTARDGRLVTMEDVDDPSLPAIAVVGPSASEAVIDLEPFLLRLAGAHRAQAKGQSATASGGSVSRTFLTQILQPAFAVWRTLTTETDVALTAASGARYLAFDLFGWEALYPALYGIDGRAFEAFLAADTVSEELEQDVGLLQGIAEYLETQFPTQTVRVRRSLLMAIVGELAAALRAQSRLTAALLCTASEQVVNATVRARKERFYGVVIDQLIGEQRALRPHRDVLTARVATLLAQPFDAGQQAALRAYARSLGST
ncbi:MAG: hypothetical protein HY696_08190 [Deltaproteobacteria bacterium]|nr:hypothetical protein [Deltaproteobacteria bacterium]